MRPILSAKELKPGEFYYIKNNLWCSGEKDDKYRFGFYLPANTIFLIIDKESQLGIDKDKLTISILSKDKVAHFKCYETYMGFLEVK